MLHVLLLALLAQTSGQSLAALALSETPALDTAPDLARWRTMHPNERLRPAAYDNEYESQGLWCADSIAEVTLPGGVKATRQAFFYVPSVKPGDALPARQDAGLVNQCRLLALWYEVHDPAGPDGLVKSVSAELSASLGTAEEPSRFKRPDGDWGSGYWNPICSGSARIGVWYWRSIRVATYPNRVRTRACSSSRVLHRRRADYRSTGWAKPLRASRLSEPALLTTAATTGRTD